MASTCEGFFIRSAASLQLVHRLFCLGLSSPPPSCKGLLLHMCVHVCLCLLCVCCICVGSDCGETTSYLTIIKSSMHCNISSTSMCGLMGWTSYFWNDFLFSSISFWISLSLSFLTVSHERRQFGDSRLDIVECCDCHRFSLPSVCLSVCLSFSSPPPFCYCKFPV